MITWRARRLFWAAGVLAILLLSGAAFAAGASDRRQRRPRLVFPLGPWGVAAAAFSADEKLLVTAGDNAEAVLWDLATGLELRRVFLRGRPLSLAFTPDRERLMVSSWEETVILDPATGEKLTRLKGGPAVLTPDGRYVITRGGAEWYDIASGARVRTSLLRG
jgi:hypothetical protein